MALWSICIVLGNYKARRSQHQRYHSRKRYHCLPNNHRPYIWLLEEGLVFDKDWEKDITQETVDIMLYGRARPITKDRVELIKFLRTVYLSYICRLIHNFMFNMVIPRLGFKDYVNYQDRFCMNKIMVGEKVNIPKDILYY